MFSCFCQQDSQINVDRGWLGRYRKNVIALPFSKLQFALSWITPRNDVVVHNNGDFYSAENLASPGEAEVSKRSLIKARRVVSSSLTVTVTSKSTSPCASGRHPPRSRTNVRPATSVRDGASMTPTTSDS